MINMMLSILRGLLEDSYLLRPVHDLLPAQGFADGCCSTEPDGRPDIRICHGLSTARVAARAEEIDRVSMPMIFLLKGPGVSFSHNKMPARKQ